MSTPLKKKKKQEPTGWQSSTESLQAGRVQQCSSFFQKKYTAFIPRENRIRLRQLPAHHWTAHSQIPSCEILVLVRMYTEHKRLQATGIENPKCQLWHVAGYCIHVSQLQKWQHFSKPPFWKSPQLMVPNKWVYHTALFFRVLHSSWKYSSWLGHDWHPQKHAWCLQLKVK